MSGYDLVLESSGDGWMGTYANLVRAAVADMLDDGPYSPVEVTTSDGTTLTGTLDVWQSVNDFTITEPGELPRVVEVDDVVGFKA